MSDSKLIELLTQVIIDSDLSYLSHEQIRESVIERLIPNLDLAGLEVRPKNKLIEYGRLKLESSEKMVDTINTI